MLTQLIGEVVEKCAYFQFFFWKAQSEISDDDDYFSNRSKSSACLLHTDPRSRYQIRLPPKLPGMHYSVDEQCQILFGTNATFCNEMEVRHVSV